MPEINTFIQVARHLETEKVMERETRSLLEAGAEHDGAKLITITEGEKRRIVGNGLSIEVVPLYEWLVR